MIRKFAETQRHTFPVDVNSLACRIRKLQCRVADALLTLDMGACNFTCSKDRIMGKVSFAAIILLLLIISSALSISTTLLAHSAEGGRSIRNNSLGVKVRMRNIGAEETAAANQNESHMATSLPPGAQLYPSLKKYAMEHCFDFMKVYTSLLDHNLEVWSKTGSERSRAGLDHKRASVNSAAGLHLYIFDNNLFIDRRFASEPNHGATQSLFLHFKYLRKKAGLPDLALLTSTYGSSSHLLGDKLLAVPRLSFCSRPELSFPFFLDGKPAAVSGRENLHG